MISENLQGNVVNKITKDNLKEAAAKMKAGKVDVTSAFQTEAISNAPDSFFTLLSKAFREWARHGHISSSILLCAFRPARKGRKDPSKSSNYRALVGCSLILKLLEYTIILLWGDCILQDLLQFGYIRHMSTQQ